MLLPLLFVSIVAPAQDSTTSLSGAGLSKAAVKEAVRQKEFPDSGEITDPELRARMGSLSRYSLTATFLYDGPVLADPKRPNQPNPDAAVGVYATQIRGSFGGRYRLDENESVTLTAGLNALYPLHGMKRTDLNNPTIGYDWSARVGGWQLRAAPGLAAITIPEYREVGQVAAVQLATSAVYDFGTTPYAFSLNMFYQRPYFDRPYESEDGKVSRSFVVLTPEVKDNLDQHLNVFTGFRFYEFNPRSRQDEWTWQSRVIAQRIGFGYGYKRDVYVSPFLVFFPQRMSWDQTTVNFSAVISGL